MADDMFDLFRRELDALQKDHRSSLKRMEKLHADQLVTLQERADYELRQVSADAERIHITNANFAKNVNNAWQLLAEINKKLWLLTLPPIATLLLVGGLVLLGYLLGSEFTYQDAYDKGARDSRIYAFEHPEEFRQRKQEWEEQQKSQ